MENACSILTHFLWGVGGRNATHFMDKCFSGHLGVSDKRRIPAGGFSAIPGTAPGVTPRIMGWAFLSQVIRCHSQNPFLDSESGSENTPEKIGNSIQKGISEPQKFP